MRIIKKEESIFPDKLRKIKPEVKQLYIEGDIENLNKFGISIIGSRNSSKEGEKLAKEFTQKLVEKGVIIISGLAMRNRFSSS